jgi:uncharacterized membrane protein YfcA
MRQAARVYRVGAAACLGIAYLALLLLAPLDPRLLWELRFLPGVGLLAAVIANTSGTGGGVVFVPVFNILRAEGVMSLDRTHVVAASFLIQCFGMTMGALRWGSGVYRGARPDSGILPRDVWRIVATVLGVSLPVMLATQRLARFDPHDVLLAFKGFSILLGATLILTTWTVNRSRPEHTRLHRIDLAALFALSAAGGFITALFSVGTGEFLALYLFIRHYPLVTCTASAVIVSSVSALAGAPYHVLAGTVRWEVVALAAPGAILRGFLARPLALWLGPRRLKTADGAWIILSSLYLILLNV